MRHDDSHRNDPRNGSGLELRLQTHESAAGAAPPADDHVIVRHDPVQDLFLRQLLVQMDREAGVKPVKLESGGFFIPRLGHA